MKNQRKHKRFKLDVIDLSSKMSAVGTVEIIDISLSGIALKADRMLAIGKEYLMVLEYEGMHVNVKGVVIRSELSRMEERADGQKVTVYSAGIAFKDESADRVKDFLDSIDNNRKTQVPEQPGWFYRDIHFSITIPSEQVLNLLVQFNLKEISQSGVIIQTDQKLNVDGIVLIELSLSACGPASFMGKVVSCRAAQDTALGNYVIGIEFSELMERDRPSLEKIIECVRENITDDASG